MIGQFISHYRILEKLGGGGMGVVYKAEDTKLHRTVALKFLPPELTRDEEAKQRFIHEAQAASSLDHNNICAVHEVDETDDGRLFICMNYYDGETLKKKIERDPLKIDEAIEITIQIATGLRKAHEKGIIHRDIKPANILITNDGIVKILDFGLAKLSDQTMITKMGSTPGTVAYMSPEQASGEEVDHRTDIWSLAVVLYEMITRKLPFNSEYEQVIIYSILNKEPEPPTVLRAELPIGLENIILKSLSKDPKKRYPSLDDLVIDLQRILKEYARFQNRGIKKIYQKIRWYRPNIKKRTSLKWKWIAVVSILILFLLSLAYLNFYKRTLRPNVDAVTRVLPLPFRMMMYSGLSGDGNWVVFWALSPDTSWDLYQVHSSGGEPRRIIRQGRWHSGWQVDISSDGSQIAFSAFEEEGTPIYILPTTAANPKKMVNNATGFRWRPDGKRIGYIFWNDRQQHEFWSIKTTGEDDRREFTDTVKPGWQNFQFCYSPDGNSVAWIRNFPEGYQEIFIHNLLTHEERQLTFNKKTIEDVTWTNQSCIVFASTIAGPLNLWMIPEQGGDAVQLTRGSGPDDHPRISKDGTRLLYQSLQMVGYLMIASISGKEWQQVNFDDKTIYGGLGFSPDGKRLAASMVDPRFGWSGQLIRCFIMDRDGSNRQEIKITDDEKTYFSSWSPDGRRIAFWAIPSRVVGEYENDSADFCIVDISGSAPPKRMTKFSNMGYSWWIDSVNVVVCLYPLKSYVCNLSDKTITPNSDDSTWIIPLKGKNNLLQTDFRKGSEGWWIIHNNGKVQLKNRLANLRATLSPDMRWLVISEKDGGGGGKIEIISLPDGKKKVLRIETPEFGWWGLNLGYGGKELILSTREFKGQISIIENPFTY